MSRKASKQVYFSPDVYDNSTTILKHSNSAKLAGNRKRGAGICSFRLPKTSVFSPTRLLRRVGAKVARALKLASSRRRTSSRKVSSCNLPRSWSYAEPIASHQAEAIEDCIEFLNSSSLHRSNSASANCS